MRMQTHKRSFKAKSRKIYAMVINNIPKEERMATLQDAKWKKQTIVSGINGIIFNEKRELRQQEVTAMTSRQLEENLLMQVNRIFPELKKKSLNRSATIV